MRKAIIGFLIVCFLCCSSIYILAHSDIVLSHWYKERFQPSHAAEIAEIPVLEGDVSIGEIVDEQIADAHGQLERQIAPNDWLNKLDKEIRRDRSDYIIRLQEMTDELTMEMFADYTERKKSEISSEIDQEIAMFLEGLLDE